MTNAYLVECIYRDFNTEIIKYIKGKLFHKDYTDDLVQEVYIALLKLPNESLKDVYFTEAVMFYIQRIVLNMLNNKNSVFHKQKKISNEYEIKDEEDDTIEIDDRIQIIHEVLEENKFFNALYKYKLAHNVKLPKIENDLKISKRTLKYQFTKINKKIKEEYDKSRN